MKMLPVLAVVHYGKYEENGAIIDDKCPCCNWDPTETPEWKATGDTGGPRIPGDHAAWHLGEIWAPGAEKGIGAYYRIFHCQGCGLVYATHLN